ncbi:alpha/beta hydrolase [Methylosinus sp. R-45379]|uniref:alpha/beta hydrolase n=1 Tax=Methylosinus sp. R-45379 TaxID=980563 RepID=UPI001FD9E9FB|nr:alpha/beta hydrolase [Methylosinus sp. R-45379]
MFFHGGGFMIGDLDFEHARCLKWCHGARLVVVSCDYRLSPEFPYPAPLDDSYASLLWTVENAESIGVDRNRIAVAGASCGGCLAAGALLRNRDDGGPNVALQMLLYPVLDDRLQTRSMIESVSTPGWDQPSSVHMWRRYLGEQRQEHPAYAAPARANDLSGLPPTYVMTAEMDPLRDEGIDYAMSLMHAGVSVELHNYAGTYHGFDAVDSAAIARRAIDEQIGALRRALRRD